MKKIFKYLGVLFLLLLVACVSLYFYLMPLFDELGAVSFDIYGLRVGKGWHSYSASSTSNMGGIRCEGYHFLLFCISDQRLYCKYFEPTKPIDNCLCESVTDYYKGSYRRYCEKNKQCYTNTWEYEFGCAKDLKEVCKTAEEVFVSPNACSSWYDSAQSYGFVKKGSECSQSWMQIYNSADSTIKKNLFEKGFVLAGTETMRDLCNLICNNCESILCTENNLCEYAVNPSDNASIVGSVGGAA